MKKIYALFLGMLAFAWLAVVPAANAQYAVTDYTVRVVANAFVDLAGQGTDITEIDPVNYYEYYKVSNEITLPFNFRFVNTVTNKIKVEQTGNVICGGSATWPDGANYDYGNYYYYSIYYNQFVYPQYGYGYYANNSIRPFNALSDGTPGQAKYNYVVQGSAPNRTVTIQSTNMQTYYYRDNTASWQVVLYEVGANTGFVSKILINYGQATTTASWNYAGFYARDIGIKTSGYCGGEESVYMDNNPAIGSTPTYTTCGAYGNSIVPTKSIAFSILYDYNLSFTNPSVVPADTKILLINNPIVDPTKSPFVNGPSIKIANEGRLSFSAVTMRLVITGDPTNPYDQSVSLPAAGAIPGPFGGQSGYITFPNYTPVNYGLYTMTWTVSSSTPTDQFPPDNTYVSSFIVSPPNNIAAVKALSPAPAVTGNLVRSPINIPTPVAFEYRNLGVNDQLNGVPVAVYIKNPSGAVVYRDTQILYNFLSSQIRDTNFKDFTPTQNGVYTICGMSMMTNPTDQNHLDDTVCSPFLVAYEADVAALSIFNPDDQEEKPEKVGFKAGAYFQSVGVTDLFDVPVRLKIMRCSDNTLVFQADTIMPELNVDQGAVKMFFPSKQGIYDIANLAPGCYQMCAIAKQPNDGDRSNDTTCTFFAIIPRLSGNINVGVGQRFQTISAATDSLRFRGVKAPGVNLILTDANYTENGNTSVSTPTAAVDFTGIRFTDTNAWITWKPKQGVNPVITFTGNKQNCFQMSFRSCPYMAFDGNNQFAPSADLVTPEPAKRGITIINQSSTPGSVFDMEYGRHDLKLKNLRIFNNGNMTDANSHAINMVNIYSFNSFVTGVNDTTPNYNITIDNNEIGNSSIGIWDVGTIPLFDINQAIFFPKRNHDNRITRNTIGSQANQIGQVGIHLGNEERTYVGHNEISWVSGAPTSTYGGAISIIDGNTANAWIDANRIHNIGSITPSLANTLVGIDIQQPATIYTQGTGSSQKRSTLPTGTGNRITNNMIYDMRVLNAAQTTVLPITISTGAANYFIDNDSIFNNSLSVKNAPALITVTRMGRPFLWNNVLQNLNTSSNPTAVLYNLTVPRPSLLNVSSNYNDIDLRNSTIFATLNEVDRATGTFIQTKTFKSLNDWRTYTQQDMSSVTGDPMFRADSLHLPAATSYILSPASNNGAWLGTMTQTFDFDGDQRLVANNTPDIGADEFEGFQYVNDLAVQVITKPAGITDNSGTVSVTAENPLAIQAIVKNQGGIQAFNRNVYSKVEVSTDGGATWNLYFAPGSGSPTSTLTGLHFDVAETKVLNFTGPTISNEAGKLFRVTVSVDPDQNNSNNSLTKVFKLLVKRAAVLLSYENSTAQGQKNKDSLAAALQRLGVAYDSINRVTYGTGPIDYTPWWTIVWSTGNPALAYNGALGVGAVSLKEEDEIINFLRAGQTYAKKSFVIAGENIAKYNDTTSAFRQLNNPITDNELMTTWLHTQFVARYPGINWPTAAPVQYRGVAKGVGNYFRFPDSLMGTNALVGNGGPNVVKVNPATGIVGDNVSRVAYTYSPHPSTPLDSGAGTAWTGSTFNIVFYPFDWSDPFQTPGTRDGEAFPSNVSGTTRFLRGALDFIQSFHGTVLPVEFASVSGKALQSGNQITWTVTAAKSVDHYEVEMLTGSDWNWVGQAKASAATDYSFLHTADAAFATGQTFTYRIVAVDLDGSRTTSMTTSFDRTAAGSEFSLEQNFPNPFASTTEFSFSLPENGTVSLRILDMTGKVVATPINSVDFSAGRNQFNMNAANLASGTYVYELTFVNANGEVSKLSRKMTLNK